MLNAVRSYLYSLWLDRYNNEKDNQPKNWDTLLEDICMGTLADLIYLLACLYNTKTFCRLLAYYTKCIHMQPQ